MQLRVKDVAMHYFFVIYDHNDFAKFMCEDIYELSNLLGQRPVDIVRRFNKNNASVIPVVIGQRIYTLYMFIR